MLCLSVLLASALVLQPSLLRRAPHPELTTPRSALLHVRAQSLYANDGAGDGEGVDWDKEAAALARPMNRYFKAIKEVEGPELVKEFASTAPPEVQTAVKLTISQLLGNLPPQVAESVIETKGQSLASLMFSMQMTGYMFRNAEYRRSLKQSINPSETPNTALPAVRGTIKVKFGEGLETEVDASSYMAELRSEVEGLRESLALAKQKEEDGGEMALIKYIQSLGPENGKELTSEVTPDVLEAMGQLVASLLIDMNVTSDMTASAPVGKVRELLITQLVTGYKLRELEVRDALKSKFWDQ